MSGIDWHCSVLDLPSEMRLNILEYIIPKELLIRKGSKLAFLEAVEELLDYILISKHLFYEIVVEECDSYDPILVLWGKIADTCHSRFKELKLDKFIKDRMDKMKVLQFISILNSSELFSEAAEFPLWTIEKCKYLDNLVDERKANSKDLERFRMRLNRFHGITQNFKHTSQILNWFFHKYLVSEFSNEISRIHKTKKLNPIKNEHMLNLIRVFFNRNRVNVEFPKGWSQFVMIVAYTEIMTDSQDDLFECLVSSCIVGNSKGRNEISLGILRLLFDNPVREGSNKFCVIHSIFAKKNFKRFKELSEYIIEYQETELILTGIREMISSYFYFYNYLENDPNCLKEILEIFTIYCNLVERSFTKEEVLSIVKTLTGSTKDANSFIKIYDSLFKMNTKAIGKEMETEILFDSIVLTSKYSNLLGVLLQRGNYRDVFMDKCKDGSIFIKIWDQIIKFDEKLECFRLVYQHIDLENFELRMNSIKRILGSKTFQSYLKNSKLPQLTTIVTTQCSPYKNTSAIKRIINQINIYLNQFINHENITKTQNK